MYNGQHPANNTAFAENVLAPKVTTHVSKLLWLYLLNVWENNHIINHLKNNFLIFNFRPGSLIVSLLLQVPEKLSDDNQIICFNVGGKKFFVSKSNFSTFPNTRLGQLVSQCVFIEFFIFWDVFTHIYFQLNFQGGKRWLFMNILL